MAFCRERKRGWRGWRKTKKSKRWKAFPLTKLFFIFQTAQWLLMDKKKYKTRRHMLLNIFWSHWTASDIFFRRNPWINTLSNVERRIACHKSHLQHVLGDTPMLSRTGSCLVSLWFTDKYSTSGAPSCRLSRRAPDYVLCSNSVGLIGTTWKHGSKLDLTGHAGLYLLRSYVCIERWDLGPSVMGT